MRTRHCKLTLQITVDNEARVYTIKLVRPLPNNTAQALFLQNGKNGKIYEVNVSMDGYCGCSCMGFDSSKHCKHIDSLMALGVLTPEPFMRTNKCYLEMKSLAYDTAEERQRLIQQQQAIRDAGSCCGSLDAPPLVLTSGPPKKPKRIRKSKRNDAA